MLVDDEPRQLNSQLALLEGAGLRIFTALGGARAIKILAEYSIDIVLLDLNMPDVSGHDVMAFIREHSPHTTVLVMSGDPEIDSAISALRLGAYAFLRKPCQAEELVATLKGALEKRYIEKKNRAVALDLQFSQQRFKFLAENCPDIIYIVDTSGRLTYINESVSALLGFAPRDLIGQSYCVLVPESETDRARYVFQERRVGVRASKDVEIQVKCKHMEAWEDRLSGSNSRAISFTSMAIYDNSHDSSERRYLGTYGIARDLSEVKAAQALASFHANHDTLTGLPNRLLFSDRLEVALVQARRKSVEAAVMFIDLDRFKSINDSLGHFSGDRLLRSVATRFRQTARKADTLARFGGDEFVLLLGEITDRGHAALVAKKLTQSLNEPFLLNGRAVKISASIGIAVFPTDGESIEELMRHADMAMYQAKNAGRNSHEFYDSTGGSAAQRKARSGKAIRAALAQDAFELRYQPQVDVHSGEVVRLAAAIRWNDPRAGLLSDADFLAAIDNTGPIESLNQWMVDTLCRDLREWKEKGHGNVTVALRLSSGFLDRGTRLQQFCKQLECHGISPSRIELEITEALRNRNPGACVERLQRLSGRGFKLALCEFGSNDSSLDLLGELPVQTLKIAKSLVGEIDDRNGAYPLVRAIVAMANGLGLGVVAEGVDTENQSAFLADAGCTTMQGSHFYQPLAKVDAATLLFRAAAPANLA